MRARKKSFATAGAALPFVTARGGLGSCPREALGTGLGDSSSESATLLAAALLTFARDITVLTAPFTARGGRFVAVAGALGKSGREGREGRVGRPLVIVPSREAIHPSCGPG
jgi:hypothetical protein